MAVDRDTFKALYEYQKIQFDEEKTRYSKLEDKATKFLTSLTVVISAFTLIVGKFVESMPQDTNCILKWSFFIITALTFFCFCSAWSCIFRTLKLRDVPKMSSDLTTIDFFLDNSLDSVYWDRAEKYSNAIDLYRIQNKDKTDLMSTGYMEITFASWLFVVSICLMVIIKLV